MGFRGPLQTSLNHRTTTADLFCLCDLKERGVRRPDREEQFWSHIQTSGAVAPRHYDRAPRPDVVRLEVMLVGLGGAWFGVTVLLRWYIGGAGVVVKRSRRS